MSNSVWDQSNDVLVWLGVPGIDGLVAYYNWLCVDQTRLSTAMKRRRDATLT